MFEPIRLSTPDKAAEVPRVPLFYIDDFEITIPEKFSASYALRYVDVVTTRGLDAGTTWLLKTALSPGGYEALLSYDDLEADQLNTIITHLQQMIVGAMDGPKGAKLRSA